MKTIDLSNWARREHYNFFKNSDYGQFNVCFNLDITKFVRKVRSEKHSFYYSLIYVATYAVNQMENFRYRLRGADVVLHDIVQPVFTDMIAGTDLFKMVTSSMEKSLPEFVEKTSAKAKKQQSFRNPAEQENRDDLIYITCLPKVSFTHISHTISLDKDDSIPRISWGKYFTEGEKILLPFSLQAHHCLVDGIHIGKYAEYLQELLDDDTKYSSK